jgi:hypothetical protein
MKSKGIEYKFTAKPFSYSQGDSWRFVSLPQEMAKEIRENLRFLEEGWGRMKASAKIGASEWETAIWFDTKHKTYLLPLKAEIRKRENIGTDKDIEITIWV